MTAAPRLAVVAAVALAVALSAAPAAAGVVRYAVIVGANNGEAGERPLSFAEADAERMADVLGDLGDVPAENQVLLRGASAAAVRRAVIAVNDRIRVTRRDGDETVLLVYYSGHADAAALHLAGERLELGEVEALVRGSPADVRILVIDACRSGAVTRVKGGRPAPAVDLDHRLGGEGLVFLTSSAAGEDAQESDDIGGSFFTHYLTSGLLGAADADADGSVTVAEAFRFAREQTIVASSRTISGTQHPTFRYELRGHGEITLTRPRAAQRRGTLTLPGGLGWLVIKDTARGRVTAEIDAAADARTLSLRPGRYFVRGRGGDALYEGTIWLDRAHTVQLATLDRIAYARLVRKGGGPSSVSGPIFALAARSGFTTAEWPCLGAVGGWAWELREVTISPRIGFCRTGHRPLYTDQEATYGATAELRVSHAWDLRPVSLDLGITLGYGAQLDTPGSTVIATTAPYLDASVAVTSPEATYVWFELGLQSHFFDNGTSDIYNDEGATFSAMFAIRALAGVGFRLGRTDPPRMIPGSRAPGMVTPRPAPR